MIGNESKNDEFLREIDGKEDGHILDEILCNR